MSIQQSELEAAPCSVSGWHNWLYSKW